MNEKKQKTYMTLPGFHAGMLNPEDLERLAQLARTYAIPGIKITSAQRIALLGAEPEQLSALQRDLKLDTTPPHSRNRVHYVQACPGKTWCKYGVQDSLPLGEKIEQIELVGPLPYKVKVGISGCRMCCCESWMRDIGLIGEQKGWKLIFGGNAAGRPRIGDVLAEGLSDDEAIELIRKTLNYYIQEARGKTRTARLMERIGIETLKEAILGQPKSTVLEQTTGERPMKSVRKIIEINDELCNGCGLCVPDCAEGSLRIIDGKARLVADKLCDGLGACLGSCPTGALKVIEREADEFDEEAVEEFLAQEKGQPMSKKSVPSAPRGCPSSGLQVFNAASPCQEANKPNSMKPQSATSALTHWPIQIRLIPPHAPFLENADLLVAADCTAVSYANLHADFLQGKVVMMGCPKFDDQDLYVDRFTEIFRTRPIKSLTILIMEVPCCHALLPIIRTAYDAAKATFPVQHIVIARQGGIVSQNNW